MDTLEHVRSGDRFDAIDSRPIQSNQFGCVDSVTEEVQHADSCYPQDNNPESIKS